RNRETSHETRFRKRCARARRRQHRDRRPKRSGCQTTPSVVSTPFVARRRHQDRAQPPSKRSTFRKAFQNVGLVAVPEMGRRSARTCRAFGESRETKPGFLVLYAN